jgi:MYXO-CTERM domain-containing protein
MVLMGLLWVGQGLGLIMWPAESFMLADRKWAINGAVLAAVGLALIWFSRRRR